MTTHIPGPELAAEDETRVAAADAVVVVAGLTGADEGELLPSEGGDRTTLDLHAEEVALIERTLALNPRTVVVVEGGSAITMLPWSDAAPAILMAWYPGMQGGNAVGEVLFGDVAPSGRLPITFPRTAGQLPPFDNVSATVEYGYFHGYRLFDRDAAEPLFAFGHGLAYTRFEYSALRLESDHVSTDGLVRASFDVTNAGDRGGSEVSQLYAGCRGSTVERAVRELRGFARVALEPGATERIALEVKASDLGYWDEALGAFHTEPLSCTVWVGRSSRDLPLEASFELVE